MGGISRRNKKMSLFNNTDDIADNLSADTFNNHIENPNALIGLNAGQKKMVIGIWEYLITNKEDKKYFTIQGGGGTGKSYTIYRAISNISPSKVVAAAPSHFAKGVLQVFMGEHYSVKTIASLLGKKVSQDRDGNEILIKNKKVAQPPIELYSIVIVDECSMVNDETANELISISETLGIKLIVMGDYAQLPPVGQHTDSMFFDDIAVTLLESMRFSDNIKRISDVVRGEIDNIRKGENAYLNILNREFDRISEISNTGEGYVFLNSSKIFLNAAIKRFRAGKGSDYIRIVAFRNKTVNDLNEVVRIGLYGVDAAEYENGEILINNGGYSVITPNNKSKLLINNGSIFSVSHTKPLLKEVDGIIYECIELFFEGKEFPYPIITLSEEGKRVFNETLSEMKEKASARRLSWSNVKAFKEEFAVFDYAYAVNTHKVQGSTIQHVFIVEEDIMSIKPTTMKEKFQALYVSITRSAFRVYIFNPKFPVDNSRLSADNLRKNSL